MSSHAGAQDLSAARVLLVDDDEVSLVLTAAALTDRGFTVREVPSGEAALQALAEDMPDVIVLDAMMPGLDGFTVCRQLRRTPGFEMVPVLMLTGLDDEASIERAYQAGATDFFVKTNQWSLLAGRLRYLLRSARTSLELDKSRSKLARAQDLARMGSFDWRASTGLEMSTEALRVVGQRPQARFGLRSLLRMVEAGQRAAALNLLRQVVQHSTVLDSDVSVVVGDGRQRVLHIEAEPEFNEAGNVSGYTGIVQDVTDRRVIEDKIKHLANFDSLTGLPNRRQLIWRAERALEQARRHGHGCALLLIDLDRFKMINDTLGHGVGDELLVECGRRLRSCVRHSDQIAELAMDTTVLRSHRSLEAVGRLGGDEFVALLPELDHEGDAEQVAQRMLEVMREPVVLGGNEYFVTASVGVAVFPRDGVTVVDLLRNADVAMYSVKGAGRNGLQAYQPHLAGKGRERLALESALYKAMERGELVLHYQPKIDLRSNRVVGAEALMRWRRNGELVAPSEFIPLAEETGLILPMSDWALREAARQVRAWRDEAGLDLSLAVNLPSRVFERADLVGTIRQAAADNGIPPRTLELEITETGLMKDLQVVIPALLQLNQLGVEISIDDFGTGYSSLAYLTSLPISEVKIDRSFVRELGITEQSSAVVTAVIALARSLGLRVIAEGVETQRQMTVLSRLGCHLMQGFFFTRALPGPDMARWVASVMEAPSPPWTLLQPQAWGTPQALTPRIAHTR
jgi:predicted signal transduction protein with EAL and GGDEF domain/FixJ family two-component response regulator